MDAAAISNLDLDDDEVITDRFMSDIRVLHATRAVPRSVMLFRASLSEETKQGLLDVLLDMHQSDAGTAVLRKYFKVRRFENMGASEAEGLDWARQAYKAKQAC